MKKLKVVSYWPRVGSHWLHNHVKAYNIKNGLLLPGDMVEFFRSEDYSMSKADKIEWLQKEKDVGKEYTYKVSTLQLGEEYVDWFNEFYNDWDIILLDRKDKWRAFLSYVVLWNADETFTSLYHNHKTIEDRDTYRAKIEKGITATNMEDKSWFQGLLKWTEATKALDMKLNGEKMWYEDMSDTKLNKLCKPNRRYIPNTEINYEDNISNIDYVREIFEKNFV